MRSFRANTRPTLRHACMAICAISLTAATFAQSTPPAAVPAEQSAVASAPFTVRQFERRTKDGQPIRGLIATIDLRDPRVEILVTDPLDRPIEGSPNAEARLETVDVWAKRVNADLAVNANFFGRAGGEKEFVANAPADVIGLSVSDAKVVSAPREFKGKGDPALVFGKDRHAAITRQDAHLSKDVFDAVAGIGGSETDPNRGDQLVTAGVSTADKARVEPNARHPRTAAGVSKDGWTLYLVTIDGRQKDWSVGMTLPELATLMIELGSHDAINLDGGGSTTMIYRELGSSSYQTNKPSEKAGFRPVANALGVRVHKQVSDKPAEGATPK